MIINCEAAVCLPDASRRFSRAIAGVGFDIVHKSHFLVVVRTNQRDKFRLHKSNVQIRRHSFEFTTPNQYVMFRDCDEDLLQSLKSLVRKIIDNQSSLPKLPSVDRIYSMKPSQTTVSSLGASKADLKKLKNKCLKTIELSSLKKIPREVWSLNNLSILKLTDCKIKYIPREMHQLNQTLNCLVMRNNEIDEIPMWFCKRMQSLKTLDLSWNKLKKIPFEIVLLKSCKSFNFNHNFLWSLPNIFSMKIFTATVYDRIDLSHNHLHYIHANETKMNNGQSSLHSTIDFSHNKFSCDYNLSARFESIASKRDDISLFSIALEKVVSDQRLLAKMFIDTVTPRPIYKAMQECIFMCYRCKKLTTRLGSFTINTVNHFPLKNFSGLLSHDFSPKITIVYLYCKLCKWTRQTRPVIEGFEYLNKEYEHSNCIRISTV